ncbi:MAG: response regulator transcription factor [Anaerolineaceae bacterium]|jgi:DNA-binding NarL/FixJ family response regulator|nr:response regulator transcription factor [Anaerolineaceae bacterium]MDI9530994.1 response regulator transcription factor [Chloroflexota bacterium]HNZ15651.1 response regulator transcription factor [Anaerolineaceae bacterium]HOF28755.1 response regulator transcription factor [Anaerolineaceae bacterium]
MIRVLIADDQEIVCEGLKRILESDPEIQVTGIANDGQEALELVASQLPDLVLMDLQMPRMNGVQAIRRLRMSHPALPILVLTTYMDDKWLFDAIRSGASGYLMKDRPRQEILDAIKGTVAGDAYIDPSVAGKVLSNVASSPVTFEDMSYNLTEREQDILNLLAQGLSNADISQQLYLSEGTVRNYTSTLFAKLGVSDRTQAVILALRHGLVSGDRI